MTQFVARCLVVGAAVALLAGGVVAPVSGAARSVLIGAAACCATLDVLLTRGSRALGARPAADVVVLAAASVGGPGSVRADPVGADGDPDSDGAAVASRWAPADPAAAERHHLGTDRVPLLGADPSRLGNVVLGTCPDGSTVEVDIGTGMRAGAGGVSSVHVVVVGTGVLAAAVFRAVVAQVRARTEPLGAEVRMACAPDLRSVVSVGGERCPELPDGTAVMVADVADVADPADPADPEEVPARTRNGSVRRATVVLVAGLASAPGRWDVAVEVTRYGCTVRRAGQPRGVRVAPVLPLLDGPPS